MSEETTTEDKSKEPAKKSPATTKKSPPVVQGTYPTEYFKRTKTPYCEVCGEQFHHDSQKNPICPENFTSEHCPRLQG